MTYTYKASIIIINYRGKKYIDNLFNSLDQLATPFSDFEVIFVDNFSQDDSLDYAKDKASRCQFNVQFIESTANLGFAGGNNLGASYANGEYLAFLNNDTKVDPQWLNELLKLMKSDPTIGIANSKILFFYDFVRFDFSSIAGFLVNNQIKINDHEYRIDPRFTELVFHEPENNRVRCLGGGHMYLPLLDGDTVDYRIELEVQGKTDPYDYISLDFDPYNVEPGKMIFTIPQEDLVHIKETLIQNAGSEIGPFYDGADIGFTQQDGPKYAKSYDINSACGASMMMLKQDFQTLNGFDQLFFMYYEDSDLSLRMRKMGKRLVYCPLSIVRHFHTGTSGEWSDFFVYHVIRNKLLFIHNNYTEEAYLNERKYTLLALIRHRKHSKIRIRAVIDAKKILAGDDGIHY